MEKMSEEILEREECDVDVELYIDEVADFEDISDTAKFSTAWRGCSCCCW
jgi:hypothetical protein